MLITPAKTIIGNIIHQDMMYIVFAATLRAKLCWVESCFISYINIYDLMKKLKNL
jgi:hypothetical protein